MTEATNTSMNQTRNAQLKEHGSWVVKSLDDCNHRMNILCKPNGDKNDTDFADKNFKQRLAGISFDIAKCTKELVKTVEEASLKEDIANIDARLRSFRRLNLSQIQILRKYLYLYLSIFSLIIVLITQNLFIKYIVINVVILYTSSKSFDEIRSSKYHL